MMRFAGASLALVCILLTALPAAAQTLDTSIRQAWDRDDAGLRLLRENGAALGRVIVAERVPSGAYVVEVALQLPSQTTARYPLKLERRDTAWKLVWQPEASYASALLSTTKSNALAVTKSTQSWSSQVRLPALPIVATRKRFVTPFGEVEADPAGDFRGSPGLQRAARSWISAVLDDDPGPAGIDVLADRTMSWRALNIVLLSAASAGLYQVSMVGRGDDLNVVPVGSPVSRPPVSVLAIYRADSRLGVRLKVGDELAPSDGCAEHMTTCITNPEDLEAFLDKQTLTGPVMFAAADIDVETALPLVNAVAGRIRRPHALLVGYVSR